MQRKSELCTGEQNQHMEQRNINLITQRKIRQHILRLRFRLKFAVWLISDDELERSCVSLVQHVKTCFFFSYFIIDLFHYHHCLHFFIHKNYKKHVLISLFGMRHMLCKTFCPYTVSSFSPVFLTSDLFILFL